MSVQGRLGCGSGPSPRKLKAKVSNKSTNPNEDAMEYVVNEQHKNANGQWLEYSNHATWHTTRSDAEDAATRLLENGAEKVTIFETRLVYEQYANSDGPCVNIID